MIIKFEFLKLSYLDSIHLCKSVLCLVNIWKISVFLVVKKIENEYLFYINFFLVNDLHSCVSSLFWGNSCQHSVVVDASLAFDYSRAINFRANLAIICQFYWHCTVDCIVCSVSGSETWRKSGSCHQTLSFNSFVTGRNTVVWTTFVVKNCTTTTNLEQKKCEKIKMYPLQTKLRSYLKNL